MDTAWTAIFMLLVLKIPLVYLGYVVWYAVKAQPVPPPPLEGALVTAPLAPEPKPGWSFLRRAARPRRPRPGPHGTPNRTYSRRAPGVAAAQGPE